MSAGGPRIRALRSELHGMRATGAGPLPAGAAGVAAVRWNDNPERLPVATPAARFHRALQRAAAEPAVALPHHFRPLATAIAGTRPVAVRRGPATTAALAAAGKSAATVGGVIHLRRPLDRSPQSIEILAHELVHAAHPSPRVRFFADERHSAEEHLAVRTGGLARALVAPATAGGTGSPAPALARALVAPATARVARPAAAAGTAQVARPAVADGTARVARRTVAPGSFQVARPAAAAGSPGVDRPLAAPDRRLARALETPQTAAAPAVRSQDRLAWGTQGMAVGSLGGAVKALAGEIAAKVPTPDGGQGTVQRRTTSGGRSSLVDRTADLFRQAARSGATGPASAGGSSAAAGAGSPASGTSPGGALDPSFPRPGDPPIVRRSTWGNVQRFSTGEVPEGVAATATTATGGVDPALFEALLEALEQRVIDELERRGIRHHPGVF